MARQNAVISFSEPFVTTYRFYVGTPVDKTATGSGTGTQTATGLVSSLRTATGSGTGTASTTIQKSLFRVGSDSAGTGSSSTSRIILRSRIATGSGIGSSSADGAKSSLRTATGSGVGGSTSAGFKILFRTASASGTSDGSALGIRVFTVTATGSGNGTTGASVTWSKSRIFRVPQTTTYSFTRWMGESTSDRLFSHVPPLIRAENLFKNSAGEYTINNPGLTDTVKIYHGAHNIFLDDTEVAELTAAGYGAYIT